MKFFGKDYTKAVELVRTREDPTIVWLQWMAIGCLPPIPPEVKRIYIQSAGLLTIDELPPQLEVLSCPMNTLHSIRCSFPSTLKTLNLTDTFVTTLPPLPEGLEELFLSGTSMTELPTLPTSLLHLSVGSSKIQRLPRLPPNLQRLDIPRTQIQEIEWVPPTLKYFLASHNQLREVPDGFEALLPKTSGEVGPCYLELLPAAYLPDHDIFESTVGWWWRLVNEKKRRRYALARARMEPIKEDLMAAAWHPRRVAAWLEAGVELEDL